MELLTDIPKNEADTQRGWGPTRRDWYSICSTHRHFEPKCSRCQRGQWLNYWRWCANSAVFTVAPGVWRWWANLPWKKRAFVRKMQSWGFENFGKKP